MPAAIPLAAAAVTAGGAIYSANKNAKAAKSAANSQDAAALAGIEEQSRQFDELKALLAPYVGAGTEALGAQKNLIGLGGAGAQQAAIDALQKSPEFTSILRSGENSILQNASATGGLRGGNVQAALAQFRPAVLADLINNQYARLGGITSIGQNAAAMQGNAGMATGSGIAGLLQQQGAARAGASLASGSAASGLAGGLGSAVGLFAGLGGLGGGSSVAPGALSAYNSIGGVGFGGGASYGGLGSSLSLGAEF